MVNVVIPYSPRAWQYAKHNSLDRFTVLVIHRRAGKTVFAVNELIKRALDTDKKKPQVAYIAPTYGQAKRVSWELFKQYVAPIPGVKINESELRIDFPNGGRILVLGAENPDSLRGLYLDYVVLDEVADMPANLWDTIIYPALMDRIGGALFIGTPKGKNFFHKLYLKGKTGEKNWKSFLLKHFDTDALAREEVETYRSQVTEEVFQQEMECSFTAAIKGAFFGKQMARLEDEGRLTYAPWDEDYPVYVGFDVGLDGIALWYAQVIESEVRIIRYESYWDKDIKEVIGPIKSKAYQYEMMILPHDGKKRSVNNRKESADILLKNAGFKVKRNPWCEKIESIRFGRSLLNRAVINIKDTEEGCESLRLYRAEFDEDRGVYQDKEVHDIHSHPGQAWCTLAQGLKLNTGKEDLNTVSALIRNRNFKRAKKVNSNWDVFKRR